MTSTIAGLVLVFSDLRIALHTCLGFAKSQFKANHNFCKSSAARLFIVSPPEQLQLFISLL